MEKGTPAYPAPQRKEAAELYRLKIEMIIPPFIPVVAGMTEISPNKKGPGHLPGHHNSPTGGRS
jgi:hypothetical protein